MPVSTVPPLCSTTFGNETFTDRMLIVEALRSYELQQRDDAQNDFLEPRPGHLGRRRERDGERHGR